MMYSVKADIRIELVALLKGRREHRELKLIPEQTRAVCRNEIHEFIVTDERDHHPGDTVNRIAYLGFGEVKTGGLLAVGDMVRIDGQEVGKLVGFDRTHLPSHMNIILFSSKMLTGEEHGFSPGQVMIINR